MEFYLRIGGYMKTKKYLRELEAEVGVDWQVIARKFNRQVGKWQVIATLAILSHFIW